MMTANMFLVMRQNDFGHDQDRDFIRVFKYCYFLGKQIFFNAYIYCTVKDENILTFKTVYFLSFHFKIVCLLSPPSWTKAEPTEILGCGLVRPNLKVGHRPEHQNA